MEDALPDATHLEEDAPVDVKLRALMADAASFGADADGTCDADFEAQDDAFLGDPALVDEERAASSCRSGRSRTRNPRATKKSSRRVMSPHPRTKTSTTRTCWRGWPRWRLS